MIPIRALQTGKARLAGTLDEGAHLALATALANRVVEAARNLPTVVVSSAADVLDWARSLGLATVPDPGAGLDAAVAAGFHHWATAGMAQVIVAHADLPRAQPAALDRFASCDEIVTIVPCHRDDGTPVLTVPTAAGAFPFAYGPGSARRHAAIARRRGLPVRVVRDPDLGFDVDTPADLTELATYSA